MAIEAMGPITVEVGGVWMNEHDGHSLARHQKSKAPHALLDWGEDEFLSYMGDCQPCGIFTVVQLRDHPKGAVDSEPCPWCKQCYGLAEGGA